jgi:Predicted ATPase
MTRREPGTGERCTMPRQVFVSHSSKDKEAANAVRAALEAQGIGCWIAPRDITPGDDWSESIVRGLTECAVTVLVFSKNADASVQVRREVQFSFENSKSVIPFRIEDVLPTGAFAYYLNPVHWLSALPPPLEAHLPALIEYVRGVLGGSAATDVLTPPPPGAEPSAPPVTAAAAAVAAPPPLAAEPPGNLPEALAPLIGRAGDLARWEALLRDPATRALTLTGFGGMGKSRSALELAQRCRAAFGGGAWWVELDSARTEADLVERLAGALGVEPGAAVAAQVAERLRGAGGPSLLVLDNTEQIEAASRAVASLLKAVPDLTCLTTTRHPLELAAEKVQEVEPLPQNEAEELFRDRARARQADFERTPENAEDIAAVVAALEGVPLAIEMAAARIGVMTPRDLRARLTERFRLLQSRAAAHLPPRQRTLLEAVDWSYELLNEDDCDLLAQLSVFHGGFTLEAAEAVCDVFDVFEGVDSLRRHSFLRAATDTAAQTRRFGMLEFLRAYAERKLDERGADVAGAVRERHARYYLALAEAQGKHLRTADEAAALVVLAAEMENLRAAFAWAEQSGDRDLCTRLALALAQPLHDLGFWDELSRTLEAALKVAEGAGDAAPLVRARLLLRCASLQHDRGDLEAACAHAEAARDLFADGGDTGGEAADAENLLGLIAMDAEQFADAEAHLNAALAARAAGDHAGRAHAIYNLARLASLAGDQERAARLYEESLEPRRAAGDLRGEAKTLLSLGAVAYLREDLAAAREHYEVALGLLRVLGDKQGIATLLYNLGELAEKDGDAVRAAQLYHHAEAQFRALQSPFADLATSELERLRAALGEDAWGAARQAASECTWEDLC